MKNRPLLDRLHTYKNTLIGEEYNLFNGCLVCKMAGVSFDGRQKVLEMVDLDTPLKLERDRRNKHDFYAVRVLALVEDSWQDVGFVPSTINKKISSALDAGIVLKAKVWQKSGGGDYLHGLTITITRPE